MKTFRYMLVLLLIIAFRTILNAQTTYTAIDDGGWEDGIWDHPGVPGELDHVVIDDGHYVYTNGARNVAYCDLVFGHLYLTGANAALTVDSIMTWKNGYIIDSTSTQNGAVDIPIGALFTIDSGMFESKILDGGVTIINNGLTRVEEGFSARQYSEFYNIGTFEIITNTVFTSSGPNHGIFRNAGTVIKSGGNGTASFGNLWNFLNENGTIESMMGELELNCDGTYTDGTYSSLQGATLTMGGSNTNSNFEGTLIGSPAGVVQFKEGFLHINNPDVELNFQNDGFTWSGGTLTGNGHLMIPDTAIFHLRPSYNKLFDTGTTLDNYGTILAESGFHPTDTTSVINNYGLLDIDGDVGFFTTGFEKGTFNNQGMITKSAGSGTSNWSNWIIKNKEGAIIDADNGTIQITYLQNEQNSLIKGDATIEVPTVFNNKGIVSPGEDGPGVLNYKNDYLPASVSQLNIQIGGSNPGTEFDRLMITGDAKLDGTLNISLINGFVPDSGEVFQILTTSAGTVSDSFPAVMQPDGIYFSVDVYSTYVNLVVDSVTTLAVDRISDQFPESPELVQNYPNPFNPTTNIQFKIIKTQFVSLKVYDILGNEVTTLVNEQKPAGNYIVNFNAADLASGIYIYRIQAGNFIQTKKMILIK